MRIPARARRERLDADVQRTAGQARETVNQLKKVAEEEPTRDAFSPPLREALSGENKVDLDAKLARLQQAQEQADRQQRAREAMAGLSQVSKAFEASEPPTMQMAQKTDSLKPDEQQSLSVGLAELESLIKQAQESRQMSPQDRASQGKEALANLRAGLRDRYGNDERGTRLLAQLEQALTAEQPVDLEILKKLANELQHFSVESADRLARAGDKAEMTHVDPSQMPPTYRARIQKYFEKLSEK